MSRWHNEILSLQSSDLSLDEHLDERLLRLSVGDEDVVLTEEEAKALHEALGEWLA